MRILRSLLRTFSGAVAVNNSNGRTRLFALALPLFLLTNPQPSIAEPSSPSGDLVVQWNQELIDTLAVAGVHPSRIRVERTYAMMHVAMFDAVNAIERGYTPFRFETKASRGASAEAAAAQAAHDVLLSLYPSRAASLHALLQETLASIPPGRARQGIAIGKDIAAQVLAWRSADGWDVTPPPYVLPADPGNWLPTPPGFAAAAFTQYPSVEPFAIESSTQFLVPPPPALNSAQYTAAYNEVKALGSATSATRTADQTQAARMHASLGTTSSPPTLWNGVAQGVVQSLDMGLLDAARLFAFMNVAIHDALETSFTGKYTYGLWRPVTAIRNADTNPDTVQDPSWTPLVNAPPYPTYPGNAAAYGAAAARAMQIVLGDDYMPFSFVYTGTSGQPDITRNYSGLWDLAQEMGDSRIWAGIHFNFDTGVSQQASLALVNWIAERYMVPR